MFRYLISILTVGLISTFVNATPLDKKTLDYQFNVNSYHVWDLTPESNLCDSKKCPSDTKDPACLYYKWILSVNENISDVELKNYVDMMTTTTFSYRSGSEKKLKHNPILASNFHRPDKLESCEIYAEFKNKDVSISTTGETNSSYSFYYVDEEAVDNGAKKFLNAFNDVFPACFGTDKTIKVKEITANSPQTNDEKCAIEKVPCSNFFKTTGGNLDELHRGLIEQLISTKTKDPINDIKSCLIYLAVDEQGNRYAYNDASLSWNLVEVYLNGPNAGYNQILDDPKYPIQIKKLSEKLVEKRFPKGRGGENLKDICSDEQALALLERKIVKIDDIAIKENQELLKHTSGQLLAGKYVNDIAGGSGGSGGGAGGGGGSGGGAGGGGGSGGGASGGGTITPTSCPEPAPDSFFNAKQESLTQSCENVCKKLPSITTEEQKRCNKRCLKERKGYTYYYEQGDNTTSKNVKFQDQDIVFSNFKKTSGTEVQSYEEALVSYDQCLVSIGKKMSQDKKWETGLTTTGMAANLLMGLYGMYSTSSMNDDNFMLQVEMLRRQDQCYSLNPEQSVISNTKKRSFFGWIFSGMKSTFKEEQPYQKLSEADATTYNNLNKTYSIKNPVTGVPEDMTAYDICVLNKALSSMNQSMQNQMLCNQLMGMGIINQREYKACMMGKDLKYGTGGNTPFAKGAEKEKPIPAPEKKEKKEEEPKKDDKPAGTTPAGGGTPGSTPSASNKETPDYMRNYPYYKSSNRGGGNLGYSDGKQPYYGGGDAGTAGQNSVDLKAGTGTGADAGTAGNFLIDNIPGVESTTYNSISSGRKQK